VQPEAFFLGFLFFFFGYTLKRGCGDGGGPERPRT